jgi:hypothetical protein
MNPTKMAKKVQISIRWSGHCGRMGMHRPDDAIVYGEHMQMKDRMRITRDSTREQDNFNNRIFLRTIDPEERAELLWIIRL